MFFSCDIWTNNFSHVFTDGCPVSRKSELLENKKEMMKNSIENHVIVSKRPFQVPGLPNFNLMSDMSDFDMLYHNGVSDNKLVSTDIYNIKNRMVKNNFITRIKQVAANNGEINNILINNKVDARDGRENAFSSISETSNIHITSEVRTREFVTRQITGLGSMPEKCQATWMMMVAMHLAPSVAGDDWKDVGPNLCKEMGWSMSHLAKILLISAPRRFGKTRTISMVVINYALSLPGTIVMIYSTSQDTSNLLRRDVEECLENAGDTEFAGRRIKLTSLIGKKGERQLHLESPYKPGVYSIIYFCPGITKQNQDRFVILFFYLFI